MADNPSKRDSQAAKMSFMGSKGLSGRQSLLAKIGGFIMRKFRSERSRRHLVEILTGDEDITAVDSIVSFSTPAAFVFFLGGLWQFRDPNSCMAKAYSFVWAFSFISCGIGCFGNVLYYRQAPFHNFSIDLLTAYVHIPAYFAWKFWRRFLVSQHSLKLVQQTVLAAPDRLQDILIVATQVGFFIAGAVMMVMSAVVLMGFAHRPWVVSNFENPDMQFTSFMWWHAFIMWFVIPPVISGVFCSYSMTAFFAGLHVMDVGVFADRIDVIMSDAQAAIALMMDGGDAEEKKKLAARQKKRIENLKRNAKLNSAKSQGKISPEGGGNNDAMKAVAASLDGKKTDAGDHTPTMSEISGGAGDAQDLQKKIAAQFAELRRQKIIGEVFEEAMEDVSLSAQAVQSRLNESCRQWSNTNMHLLAFSLCQVMVVVGNLRLHTIGEMVGNGYEYNWILMDIFHLAGGVVLVTFNMGIGALVSATFKARIVHLLVRGEQLSVSRSQIAAFMIIMQNRISGFTVWGHPVDAQKCVMIMFAFMVFMVNTLSEVLASKMNALVSGIALGEN